MLGFARTFTGGGATGIEKNILITSDWSVSGIEYFTYQQVRRGVFSTRNLLTVDDTDGGIQEASNDFIVNHEDGYIYAWTSKGLRVISIDKNGAMAFVGRSTVTPFATGPRTNTIAYDSTTDRVYGLDHSNGVLYSFNVASPSAPVQVSSVSVLTNSHIIGLDTVNKGIFIGSNASNQYVNISNPAAMTTSTLNFGVTEIRSGVYNSANSTLYTADWSSIKTWNVANLGSITLRDSLSVGLTLDDIVVDFATGTGFAVGDSNARDLVCVNFTDVNNIALYDSITESDGSFGYDGGVAYDPTNEVVVFFRDTSLRSVDYANPANLIDFSPAFIPNVNARGPVRFYFPPTV
jgi:hypothetical protein